MTGPHTLGDPAGQSLLGDRYRLIRPIGSGGMAVVWEARDEVLNRIVAVKVLAGRHLGDPQSRELIRHEARAAAALSHPNIAHVHDYGETATSHGIFPYVVMELVRGDTLETRASQSAVTPRFAMRVCAEVAAALAAAHAEGIVHRDVKPANVMLAPNGAKVVDFGIAAAVAPGRTDEDFEVLGTPAYLAPERLISDVVEPASDVYALAILLYQLLAGCLPWTSQTTTQMLTDHIYVDPEPLGPTPGVPAHVVDLCNRCLAKDPTLRPSAREVSAVLAHAARAQVATGDQATDEAVAAAASPDPDPATVFTAGAPATSATGNPAAPTGSSPATSRTGNPAAPTGGSPATSTTGNPAAHSDVGFVAPAAGEPVVPTTGAAAPTTHGVAATATGGSAAAAALAAAAPPAAAPARVAGAASVPPAEPGSTPRPAGPVTAAPPAGPDSATPPAGTDRAAPPVGPNGAALAAGPGGPPPPAAALGKASRGRLPHVPNWAVAGGVAAALILVGWVVWPHDGRATDVPTAGAPVVWSSGAPGAGAGVSPPATAAPPPSSRAPGPAGAPPVGTAASPPATRPHAAGTTGSTAPTRTTKPTTAPPATGDPTTVHKLTSPGGRVKVTCPTASTALIKVAKPTKPFKLLSVDTEEGSAPAAFFKQGKTRITMTITCQDGEPSSDTTTVTG